jgi:hypothetical protein
MAIKLKFTKSSKTVMIRNHRSPCCFSCGKEFVFGELVVKANIAVHGKYMCVDCAKKLRMI